MTDHDRVILAECNIDDMTGEQLGFLLEQLQAKGALDAWFTSIQMKKNRPGTLVSLLCHEEDAHALEAYLLANSSTLGVRWRVMERMIAKRQVVTVETVWGSVRCKVKWLGDEIVSIKPEYEDCAQIARDHQLALGVVQDAARQIARQLGQAKPGDGR